MKAEHKHLLRKLLIIAAVGIGVFIAWEAYKAFRAALAAGKTAFSALSDAFFAPWNTVKAAYQVATGAASSIASDVAGAASLPAAADRSSLLDQTLTQMNSNDYAPGGRLYDFIATTQGTDAADAAWATVQKNLATQTAQTSSWWNPFTW